MYDFHYNYVKEKYDSKAKLLFTSTYNLIFEIDINGIYGRFYGEKDMFDFSNY